MAAPESQQPKPGPGLRDLGSSPTFLSNPLPPKRAGERNNREDMEREKQKRDQVGASIQNQVSWQVVLLRLGILQRSYLGLVGHVSCMQLSLNSRLHTQPG